MKSRDAFPRGRQPRRAGIHTGRKVLAAVAAFSVFAAGPASAAPIASVSVRTPIGGAPVGPAGFAAGAPGMNFSPMGANLSAPSLTGVALPGLQTFSPESAAPTARPDFAAPIPLPTTIANPNARIPSLPPAARPVADAALTGRAADHGASVASTVPLEEGAKTAEGLPRDMDGSLRTVRGKKNNLGLRFMELRGAFGMRSDEGSFSPEAAVPGSLIGRDAGSVSAAVGPAAIVPAAESSVRSERTSFSEGSALARAVARLAALVGVSSGRAGSRAPSPLSVNFSENRLGVWIFGAPAEAVARAADASFGEPGTARDRVLRVAVPTPVGASRAAVASVSSRRAVSGAARAADAFAGIPGIEFSFARRAAVRSFSGDGPVRRWLRSAVAGLNARAAAAFSFARAAGNPAASARRAVAIPAPVWISQSASGWSAWLASLIVPFVAAYVYFADSLNPRLAAAPAPVRPRA